jgi:hypothetical protein
MQKREPDPDHAVQMQKRDIQIMLCRAAIALKEKNVLRGLIQNNNWDWEVESIKNQKNLNTRATGVKQRTVFGHYQKKKLY